MNRSRTPARLAIAAALLCCGFSPDLAAQAEREQEERAVFTVYGEVVDRRSRRPVRDSRVTLAPLAKRTLQLGASVTGNAGRFTFEEVPPGWYLLTVTAQRYGEMTDSVEVPETEDLHLVLPLSAESGTLDAEVVPARAPHALRGFEARRRGGRGFVVTREEMATGNPTVLTDLLVGMRGARVVQTSAGHTLLLRGGCRPGVWLNGARLMQAPPLDQVVSLHSVAAIEVYHGFDLPAEFGADACGGVLIWTRTGPAPAGRSRDASAGDVIRRAATAVGLVLLTVLLTR